MFAGCFVTANWDSFIPTEMGLILTQAQCGSDEPKEQHESKWNFRRNCCVWLTAWPDSDLIGTKRTLIAAVCDASIGHSGHERPLRTFEDTLANELMPFETVFRKWYTRTVRKFTLKLNIIHIISYIYICLTHICILSSKGLNMHVHTENAPHSVV